MEGSPSESDFMFKVIFICCILRSQLWEHKVLETGFLSSDSIDSDEQKSAVSKNSPAASCNEHPVLTSVGPSGTVQELLTRPAGQGMQGVKRKAESLCSDGEPSKFEGRLGRTTIVEERASQSCTFCVTVL